MPVRLWPSARLNWHISRVFSDRLARYRPDGNAWSWVLVLYDRTTTPVFLSDLSTPVLNLRFTPPKEQTFLEIGESPVPVHPP